jgi:hypothetical protein
MSQFSHDAVVALTQIKIYPSRGSREPIFPFVNRYDDLSHALARAEDAFQRARSQSEKLSYFTRLNRVFEEERQFALRCERLLSAWDEMSDLAKQDVAEAANYRSFIEIYNNDEERLAERPIIPPEQMAEQFRKSLIAIRDAASTNAYVRFVVGPSKKRDYLNRKSMSPLREFSYEMKGFWDETMKESYGAQFDKKFAFSVAVGLIFQAIKRLSSDYTKEEVKRIIRSLQSKNYDPAHFRETIPGDDVLKIFVPQLQRQVRDRD